MSDWSFKKMFGRPIKSACPLAATSRVYVDISRNKVCHSCTLVEPCILEGEVK